MNYPGDVDAYSISDREIHKTRELEQEKCGCHLATHSLNNNKYLYYKKCNTLHFYVQQKPTIIIIFHSIDSKHLCLNSMFSKLFILYYALAF